MLVIIPNPSQTARLVRLQKDFIRLANAKKIPPQAEKAASHAKDSPPSAKSPSSETEAVLPPGIFFQSLPLWIFLPQYEGRFSGKEDGIKDELKGFSADILEVVLEQPRVYFSEGLRQWVLGLRSRVRMNEESCESELILCKSLGSQAGEVALGAGKNAPPAEEFSLAEDASPAEGASSPLQKDFPVRLRTFRLAWAERPSENSWAITESVWKKTK